MHLIWLEAFISGENKARRIQFEIFHLVSKEQLNEFLSRSLRMWNNIYYSREYIFLKFIVALQRLSILLTLPLSIRFVIITTTRTFCSQIILQKSLNVCSMGP